MRLRLPSCAFSWAKTAAKPAVSSIATGTRAKSSRFLAVIGDIPSRKPRVLFDFFDQGDRVFARAQVVAGDRVLAPLRQRFGLDRAGVTLAEEVDAEGQLIGSAAVEGDAAGVVGAEEPDLAVAVPGAESDGGDQEQRDEHLQSRPQPAPPRCRLDLLAPLASGFGSGALTDLGRAEAGGLGLAADQRRAFVRRPRRAAGAVVLEPEGDDGDVV